MSRAHAAVLVVGAGGRENAIAWKLSQSSRVSRVIVAPGNPGMKEYESWPVNLSEGHPAFESLAKRAQLEKIDLIVVGPDNPLADGIVDVFNRYHLLVMGPTAGAAQIEASKSFAKEVMMSAGVPSAQYWVTDSENNARNILKELSWNKPWVLKADGLAFGKGVKICQTLLEAQEGLSELFQFSKKVVIEEFLQGEEISWMAFCDGERCSLLETARDYKRLLNGAQGPNTGGMGSISPAPGVPNSWFEKVREQVFLPTLAEMKRRGVPFQGVLYAGLMVDFQKDQFWVLEFNARFGDPETQVLLPRIEGDFFEWCQAIAQGDLRSLPDRVPFSKNYAVYVVAAAKGYPEKPESGKVIEVQMNSNERVPSFFFSGVKQDDHKLLTSGGRVMGALGLGSTLEEARKTAYEKISQVHFEGIHYRTDIGSREPL